MAPSSWPRTGSMPCRREPGDLRRSEQRFAILPGARRQRSGGGHALAVGNGRRLGELSGLPAAAGMRYVGLNGSWRRHAHTAVPHRRARRPERARHDAQPPPCPRCVRHGFCRALPSGRVQGARCAASKSVGAAGRVALAQGLVGVRAVQQSLGGDAAKDPVQPGDFRNPGLAVERFLPSRVGAISSVTNRSMFCAQSLGRELCLKESIGSRICEQCMAMYHGLTKAPTLHSSGRIGKLQQSR